MFGKKIGMKETVATNDDLLLQKEMDRIISGDFEPVDVSKFQNPIYGEKLNQIILTFKKTNNNYVMRMNEAMGTIGDNAHIKKMIDQVESQSEYISNMEAASHNLEDSIDNISSKMADIQGNTHQMLKATQNSADSMKESIRTVNQSSEKIAEINAQFQQFQEKIDKINEIVNIVREVANKSNLLALNASIEAARAGEFGKGFAVVADQVRQLSTNTSESAAVIVKYVSELRQDVDTLAQSMDETTHKLEEGNQKVETSLEDIQGMNEEMEAINAAVDSIFLAIDTQSEITRNFTRQVSEIADSYGALSQDCIESGEIYYRAGRYIDTCRSDMVRKCANITQQDWLTIFEMDHFILTWRVYNNVVGFEHLKITQLNNPEGCKLGKWLAGQTDSRITNSTEIKELSAAHKEVHRWACESWNAKENGNKEAALEYFQKTFDAFQVYKDKIKKCKEMMKRIGYTDETEIIVFQK